MFQASWKAAGRFFQARGPAKRKAWQIRGFSVVLCEDAEFEFDALAYTELLKLIPPNAVEMKSDVFRMKPIDTALW